MSKKIKISDMCSRLDPHYYGDMDVENVTELEPSARRIEELVFQKMHAAADTAVKAGKRSHMKKKTGKILLIAAMLCLFATTAFAMAGGFDYFRSIFGDTVDNAKEDIYAPGVTASDDKRRMALESMLTDGYKINLIVSLETVSGGQDKEAAGKDPLDLFRTQLIPADHTAAESERGASYTCSELPEFAAGSRRFYHLQLDALENCTGWNLKISLPEDMGGLTLQSTIEGSAAAREISVNQAVDDNLTVERVQLSPLGVLVIGNEKQPSGGLPTPQIDVIFRDGSREELISAQSFDAGDGETIMGGGGAVIGDESGNGPLVVGTHGQRNPDGKVVVAGEFGRIISVKEVKAISVDGKEYAVE